MPARASRIAQVQLSRPKQARTPRKARKASYASLKRQADKVFSEWIRRSHGCVGESEWVNCATCQSGPYHWKRIQCGHFISRVHLSTRYDPKNAAPQCYACNVLRRGNPGEFALYLTREYGPSILQELVDKKRQQVKYTRSDLESIRDSYWEKIRQLETIEVLP